MNSLGINKDPKDTRVVVAMSGGVDSSVSAALLHEAGYDVIGITLQLFNYGDAIARPGSCCAGQDIYDAKRVADTRGFPHYVLDYEDRFREDVMEDFADTYLAGETPIPCVRCNQTVKFRDLISRAKELEADVLATGHYVQNIPGIRKYELHRGANGLKDQSYFLFTTTKEQLNFLRFPLGKMNKKETRNIALDLKLNVADKPESQDICFVPNGNYASVINKFSPESFKKGDICDANNNVLGKHDGIINFTIGQRKGIRISNKEPLYVVNIIAKENKVIVGNKEALFIKKIYLKDINLLSDIENCKKNLFIKVRSTGRLIKAKIKINKSEAQVNLDENEIGISPGQACVFYSKNSFGDKVLGGGWIAKTVNKYLSS